MSTESKIQIQDSSMHVLVEIDGVVVAESRRPRLLLEGSHPTRYYIPREDVRTELLMPTDSSTRCPYKGVAEYWSAEVNGTTYEDIVWSYPEPIPGSAKIRGLMCFYNENVDIIVDGEPVERPETRIS